MSPRSRSGSLAWRYLLAAPLALAVIALLFYPVGSGAASPSATSWSHGRDLAYSTILEELSPLVPPVFGPNVQANLDPNAYGQHEPSLAVSRVMTNAVFAAAKDYRQGNIKRVWIYGSTDGGTTWPVQLHMPNLPTTETESDPVVMARDDGRIYVSCLTTGNNGIFITWTDDNGQTWQPSVPIVQNQSGLQDKDWFTIDNNPASPYYHRIYMMYAPDAAFVVEHHSTDGGLTWSPRQQIGASSTEYTYPVVASDGTVYNFMMLNWGPSRPGTVQMTKSTNGGATWTTPSTVAMADQPASPIRLGDQFRFFAIISAAVDPNNGHLYVAWTDKRNIAIAGTDVVYVKSTNGGTTWSPVTRLSHTPECNRCDNITPMVIVGSDSRVHAFWLDRSFDPNHYLFDSWYTSSTDGGATWDPDTRVSDISQDLNVGFPPVSNNAAGDYWGLDTWRDTVYVAWNDARDGDQDILVSKGLMEIGGGSTPTAIPSFTATPIPPTATPTRAVSTPTATATHTPLPTTTPTSTIGPPCGVLVSNVNTSCSPPATYNYNTSVYLESGCPSNMNGSATLTFLVSETMEGPYTPHDQQTFPVTFNRGHNTFSGALTEPGIPPQYRWYHIDIIIQLDMGVNGYGRSQPAQLCVVPTVTPTAGSPTPCPPQFADVLPKNTFYPYVQCLACRGIIGGYPCGGPGESCDPENRPYFRPNNNVTRGQIAKIVSESAGLSKDPGEQIYEDVPPGSTFYVWINRLSRIGVMGGYSCGSLGEPCVPPANRPYFRPSANATRGQLAKITSNAAGFTEPPSGQSFEDVPVDHPFYEWLERLASRGIMGGYPCGGSGEPCVPPANRPYFRPASNVTRGQTSKIVAGAFFPACGVTSAGR